MTSNELELLKIIREHDNPEQALVTAIEIIFSQLIHLEVSELKSVVGFQEYV